MADATKPSGSSFGKKTILPPIGRSSDGATEHSLLEAVSGEPAGDKPKIKIRPPKLKTPLDLVIATDISLGGSHHRPIGTPPPISLRKPRHGEINTFPADPLGSFPKINVENCLDGHDEDNVESAFPALNPQEPRATMAEGNPVAPDNQRKRLLSDNNNQGVNPQDAPFSSFPSASSPSVTSLIPPQRLVTRDQDGVVFELTCQDLQPSAKTSPITPSKKPTRLEPLVK